MITSVIKIISPIPHLWVDDPYWKIASDIKISIPRSSYGVMSTDKLLFQAKTVQSLVLKTLTESIKDIITDGNFVISSDGVSLKAMDPSSTALVSVKLNAEQFEEY